jgi:hypothetical protein
MRGCSCGGRVMARFKELSRNYLRMFLKVDGKFLCGKFGVLAKV